VACTYVSTVACAQMLNWGLAQALRCSMRADLPLWHMRAHLPLGACADLSTVACAQISTGEEGFLNQKGGATWMEDGSEGGDYAANLADPNIAFGTAHCCEPPPAAFVLQLYSSALTPPLGRRTAVRPPYASVAQLCSPCHDAPADPAVRQLAALALEGVAA
jgi:hypothetical protein